MREVTWRFWVALLLGLAAYGVLGWWWSGNGNVEEWTFRVGLTAASVLPVIFTIVYSTQAKWWKNDIGTAVVCAIMSIVPTAAPLAYVFWFMGGVLHSSWLAWLEVSGPCLTTLALGWASYVWLRTARGKKKAGGNSLPEGGLWYTWLRSSHSRWLSSLMPGTSITGYGRGSCSCC